MSQQLISHNPDLKKLQDKGYDIEIRSAYLLVNNVPYVNASREVKFGTLVSDLMLAGNVTTTPNTYVAYFVGEHPCHSDGTKLTQIEHQSQQMQLLQDLVIHHLFSSTLSEIVW
jgi:hypothetical protein